MSLCQSCVFVLSLLMCTQALVGLVKECDSTASIRNLTGEVLIAGLFPLNYYSSKKAKFVRNNVAITWVEAFIFAVRQINNDDNILPGIHIGFDVRNSCNEEDIALKSVLDFMLDLSFHQKNNIKKQASYLNQTCGCDGERNRILAVVGGASSSISTSVSNILSVDVMPQISYSSTSVALSNKDKYPNFLRTLPSDIYQAKAIVALLRKFDWTYVTILASDDDYGRLGYYQLERELLKEQICIAEAKIFKRSLNSERLDEIMYKVRKGLSKRANVVILWCQIDEAKRIIEETGRVGLRGITWLGCETLGNNVDLLELGNMVEGFVGLKPTLTRVPAFEEYLDNLHPANTTPQNPWLHSYLSSMPRCVPSTSGNLTKICAESSTGRDLPRSKYSHVISAVYAVSLALHQMITNMSGTAEEKLSAVKPKMLYEEIKKVKYRDPDSGLKIEFDDEGDPEFASYTFTNIQRAAVNGSLDFVDIGEWEGETGKTVVDIKKVAWGGSKNFVSSKCSKPCNPGMYKIPGDVSCCWTCVRCRENSFSTNGNVSSCSSCPDTSISNANKTGCLQLKEIRFSTKDMIFEAFLLIASIAVLSVGFVITVYIKQWNTPVVKSSNRELSLIQLTWLFVSFWYPTSYWIKPSGFNCTLQPIWLAFCPTIVLAITFVKTYRLYRIFNKKTAEQSKILHNKYQSLAVFFILFVQMLLVVSWLQENKLKVVITVSRENMSFIRHCCDNSAILLVVSQSYNLSISLACAFMAFRARKLPNAFNEARYITFGTFTYCISWMFSIPLFLSVDIIEKNQLICAMNTVTNLALFLCFFGNKIRVILFLPQRNTKQFFTRQATVDQFVRTHTDSTSMTSSWPTLPNVRGKTWYISSSDMSINQKHGSIGSLNSLVSAKRMAGTCNPRIIKKYAPTPRDIVFAKCGRERSQTVD